MNKCLVTKLNSVVDNPNLNKIDEVSFVVNDNQNGAEMPYVIVRIKTANNEQPTFTAISDNVTVSLDGTNWAKSAKVEAMTDGFFVCYVKTNGTAGYVKVDKKYDIINLSNLTVDNNTGLMEISSEDFQYLPSIEVMSWNVKNIEITNHPSLYFIIKRLGSSSTPSGYNFATVSYDRSKKSNLSKFCEMSYSAFATIEECVNYLEDGASLSHVTFSNATTITYGQTWDIVTLSDERLASYKVRIYNALVALMTTLAPVPLNSVQLFGVVYTYSNGNLLADGVVVPDPNQ
jgi:hypothetical protein